MKTFSGVLIEAKTTGSVLLLVRAFPPHEGAWSLLAGGVEKGEDALEALKREVGEEISINPDIITYSFVRTELTHNGDMFHYYHGLAPEEFEVTLDDENLDYGWFDKDGLPEPLYPNLEYKVSEL